MTVTFAPSLIPSFSIRDFGFKILCAHFSACGPTLEYNRTFRRLNAQFHPRRLSLTSFWRKESSIVGSRFEKMISVVSSSALTLPPACPFARTAHFTFASQGFTSMLLTHSPRCRETWPHGRQIPSKIGPLAPCPSHRHIYRSDAYRLVANLGPTRLPLFLFSRCSFRFFGSGMNFARASVGTSSPPHILP